MSLQTLFLTTEEKALFDALSPELQNPWKTETETKNIEPDTPEKLQERLQNMDLEDPRIQALKADPKGLTPETLPQKIATWNLSTLGDHDLQEICTAMGPHVLSQIITHFLQQKDSDALEQAAAYSTIRHFL